MSDCWTPSWQRMKSKKKMAKLAVAEKKIEFAVAEKAKVAVAEEKVEFAVAEEKAVTAVADTQEFESNDVTILCLFTDVSLGVEDLFFAGDTAENLDLQQDYLYFDEGWSTIWSLLIKVPFLQQKMTK